jgi:hypothetical protein
MHPFVHIGAGRRRRSRAPSRNEQLLSDLKNWKSKLRAEMLKWTLRKRLFLFLNRGVTSRVALDHPEVLRAGRLLLDEYL